ncbi:hypothetical protein [Mesobacillus stamsii]|uniref:Uncharacterized protein n=1 Tax=Mesobacillus stamsii TaxID=225347 RepID=A0ABU0FYG4_9BACI|nr:hypothetical protein [Mesobacillus stamsii]MDQ0414981.1 hypothetical protein [Mesobacillus stamsii]
MKKQQIISMITQMKKPENSNTEFVDQYHNHFYEECKNSKVSKTKMDDHDRTVQYQPFVLRPYMFVGYKFDNRLYGCKNALSPEAEKLLPPLMKEYFLNTDIVKIKELFELIFWEKYDGIGNLNNAFLLLAFLKEGSIKEYAKYHNELNEKLNGKSTYSGIYHPSHFKDMNGQIYTKFIDFGESLEVINFEKMIIFDLDKDVLILEDKKMGQKQN